MPGWIPGRQRASAVDDKPAQRRHEQEKASASNRDPNDSDLQREAAADADRTVHLSREPHRHEHRDRKGQDGDGEEMAQQHSAPFSEAQRSVPRTHQAAIVHDHHLVGELLDFLPIVRDVDDWNGQLVANALQVRQDPPTKRNIECGKRVRRAAELTAPTSRRGPARSFRLFHRLRAADPSADKVVDLEMSVTRDSSGDSPGCRPYSRFRSTFMCGKRATS